MVYTLIGAFFSIMAAIEQNMIKKLLKNNALSAQKAIKLQKLIPVFRWRLNGLKHSDVIIEDDTGKCYFNESQYKTVLKKRVISVITIIVIITTLTMIYFN
jgi:hypothetical protein